MRYFFLFASLLLITACASQQQAGFLGSGRSAEAPVLVATNDTPTESSVREGCAFEPGMMDANFGFLHRLSSGTNLYVCGRKQLGEVIEGHLHVQAMGESGAEESRIFLGGTSESFTPFARELVQVERTKDGLEIVDLIPWNEKEQIPAFRRKVACDSRGCRETQTTCAFRRPRGSLNLKAFAILKKDWESAIDPNSTEQAREAVKAGGLGRYAETPSMDEVAMEVYRNALLGHKPSIALLLNEDLIARLNERYKDDVGELGGFAHNRIHKTIARLRKFRCL